MFPVQSNRQLPPKIQNKELKLEIYWSNFFNSNTKLLKKDHFYVKWHETRDCEVTTAKKGK